MKAKAKAASTPKSKIADALASLLSFSQKFKDLLPNSIQIIQRIRELQGDLNNASAGTVEVLWSGIFSELNRSMKRMSGVDANQLIANHFAQIRAAVAEFQRSPPSAVSDKRNFRKLAAELLAIVASCEQQTSNPTRAKASLQGLKARLATDFVQFFRQSQVDKFQRAKKREEITRAIDSLILIVSSNGQPLVELPPQVSAMDSLIEQLKMEEQARVAMWLSRSGTKKVKSATPPPRKAPVRQARSATPPALRASKIPTRVSSVPRDDRRKSDMGAVAHKMKLTVRKPEPKAMTSILASRKSISPAAPKVHDAMHRRGGSCTEASAEVGEMETIQRAGSIADIGMAVPLDLDSETDMMMSALSRSRIMESKTHEFLEGAVRNYDESEKAWQECMKSIRRVEVRCERFLSTFGENEAVSRFLAKIGEAKMILSEAKKDEAEALFESVENVFKGIELRTILSCEVEDSDIRERVTLMKESPHEHGVETFMRNEVDRLDKLTRVMSGFTDWKEEQEQEVEKHKDLRQKLNILRQQFADLTETRSAEKKSDAELVTEIKDKYALVQKRKEDKKVAVENASQMAESWAESEQRLFNHFHLAAQQLSKLMGARRKLVGEGLPHVMIRGMEYNLQQLDQEISQVIDRESRITKGLSKVSKGREKVIADLTLPM